MASILVVDDEPHTRRILVLQLERAGHGVETATNGAEGLEKFRSGAFDVVVTDFSMPVLDGRGLCEQVRAESGPERPLLFLMSSQPLRDSASWAEAVPNLEVLEKPLSVRRLIGRIAERLGAVEAHA